MIIKKISVLLITCLFVFSSALYAADIRIALRSHQDAKKSLAQWQPTADYLSEKIPGYRFIMVPFVNISAMNQAVSSGEYQFSFTNPSSAIEYVNHYDAQPLVTLVNKRQGKGYSQFGSVIFTRADRDDINSLKDLKGKSFVAVDEQAFGGWRVSWLEFLKNKINPFTDFKVLRFAGGKQQDVVYKVLYDKADAGTVRTDMLERMAANKEINISDFKIIGEKKTPSFPFMHSTDLYPEWLFSTAGQVDVELKNKVVKALLSISLSDQSAMKGKYVKWVKPLDYTPVDELLKELKVGPYNIATMDAYTRFISQYGTIAVVTLLIVIVLVFFTLYLLNLNRQILSAKDALNNEITLRHNLERQLIHSQRIESLGQLTGGIAHDFNNMLASISGFTELALLNSKVKDNDKLTGYLNQVLSAAERCAALVSQMLMFSRSAGDNEKKEDVSVSRLINNALQLFETTLSSDISIDINNIDEDLYIHANAATMAQVIMNLTLNAKDAITGKNGVITVGAKLSDFAGLETFCDSCHQGVTGEYIHIYIKDNGCGLDAETKEHLFEPFYSTKEVGKGSGMGLSVVHGVIHNYGGHIFVKSTVGKGTTFTVLLPKVNVTEQYADPSLSLQDLMAPTGASIKHIVIVDDEAALTIYLSDFLKNNGFETTTFNEGQLALDYITEHQGSVDLVITDQLMPGMSGSELSSKIFSISKSLPVILCSGDHSDLGEINKDSTNILASIEKPIDSDKLLETINSIFK